MGESIGKKEGTENTPDQNIDPEEVAKFADVANYWWDLEGEFKPLHEINPVRMSYIASCVNLQGLKALDVGCGGGILTESLAAAGASVTGIDPAEASLAVAKLHQHESGLTINYRCTTAEQLAEEPTTFDVITCLEMLEHVPDPASVIHACAKLLKPGGHLFVSTFNRNPMSYAQAVIGAEYTLGLLKRGTHDYSKFIRLSEYARWLRECDLQLTGMQGITYNPLTQRYRLTNSTDVSYIAHAVK